MIGFRKPACESLIPPASYPGDGIPRPVITPSQTKFVEAPRTDFFALHRDVFQSTIEVEIRILELPGRSTVGSVAITEPHSDTRSLHVFQSATGTWVHSGRRWVGRMTGLRSIFHVKIGWPGLVVFVRSHHHRCNAMSLMMPEWLTQVLGSLVEEGTDSSRGGIIDTSGSLGV